MFGVIHSSLILNPYGNENRIAVDVTRVSSRYINYRISKLFWENFGVFLKTIWSCAIVFDVSTHHGISKLIFFFLILITAFFVSKLKLITNKELKILNFNYDYQINYSLQKLQHTSNICLILNHSLYRLWIYHIFLEIFFQWIRSRC